MFNKNVVKPFPVKINVKSCKNDDNCLICLIRPILICNVVFGVSPISCKCPHNSKNVKRCTYKYSIWFILIAVLQLAFMIVMVIDKTWNLIENLRQIEKVEILFTINAILQGSLSAFYVTCGLFLVQMNIKELQGLSSLLSNSKMFGIEVFISNKTKKKIKKIILFYVILIVLYTVLHAVHAALITKNLDIWAFAYEIKTSSCFNTQLLVILHMALKLIIYKTMLQTIYQEITTVLNTRKLFPKNAPVWFCELEGVKTYREPITEKLKKLQRGHCAVIINLKQFNEACNPTLLICCSGICLLLILNYYLQITMWLAGVYDITYEYTLIKTFTVVFACIYVLVVQNRLLRTVSY